MKRLLTSLALMACSYQVPAQVRCADVHSPLRLSEKLADKAGARVMAYNLMNLMDHVGAFDQNQPYKMKPRQGNRNEPRPKTPKQQQQLSEAFHDMNADFAIVTEVESINALRFYAQKNLRDAYEPFLIEGNDPRGIDIGLLVKRSLKVKVESRSNKTEMWNDPVTKQTIPLFSRDLPIWIIKDASSGKILMALVGMHAKSKRDRDGDKESTIWRTAQMERATEIVQALAKELGPEVPLIWGGDFNTTLTGGGSPEVAQLLKVMKDSFDVAPKTVAAQARITHTFHPNNGGTHANQVDGIFVTPETAQKVLQAQIYRYKNEHGEIKKIPNSMNERNQNPSDHFPVIIDIEK